MKKFKGMMTSLSPHWATPKGIYEILDNEFNFNHDPCPLYNPLCVDGLTSVWGDRTFVNPPYGRTIGLWIKKGYELGIDGGVCVMLLPARTDTKWFHDYCMKANEIRWIRGRLKFGEAKNSAPFPSMIVVFGQARV